MADQDDRTRPGYDFQKAHKEQTEEEAFYDRGRPPGGFRGSQQ